MPSFILSLRYTADLEAVDALMNDHVAWLKKNHAAGHLVGWGRKKPRDGGIIMATGESREAVGKLAASDPFVTGGVAEVEVIEWSPSFLDDSVAGLK